jgi:choline dehydrogenase-like flavoprotein
MYDAIIVGARCAGSPTAMLLARQGFKVSSAGTLEDRLAAHEAARNERVRPMYEFTSQLATLEPPPPEMRALFGALNDNQDATNAFSVCDHRRHSAARFHVGRESRPHHGCRDSRGVPQMNDDLRGVMSCT